MSKPSLFDVAHPINGGPCSADELSMAQYKAAYDALMSQEGVLQNLPRKLVVPIEAIPYLLEKGYITQEQADEALRKAGYDNDSPPSKP